MSAVPKTAKEFGRWLDQHHEQLPFDLLRKAERALLTLKSMQQKSFGQSEAFKRESIKDLEEFATAYEAWSSSQGRGK